MNSNTLQNPPAGDLDYYITAPGDSGAVKLKLCDKLATAGFRIVEGDVRTPAADES